MTPNPRLSVALRHDLNLTKGDEYLTVLGKGGQRRTVLDTPKPVMALRNYRPSPEYEHGPLRYQHVQER